MVFKAKHMQILCAELGIHRPIHTKPYRPEGHGKIEAFNRFCINNFIAEVKASNITTLDRLNEAFFAWIDEEYNHRKHSELAMSPKKRWLRDSSRMEYLDEEKIRIAFLWRELRTPDKTAVIRLFNRAYKLSPVLAKRRVEIRYDPEHLHQIEIYLEGSFRQRAKALQIAPHRAPKEILPIQQDLRAEEKIDYLSWLTRRNKAKTTLTSARENSDSKHNLADFLSILRDRIDPEVFDQIQAIEFFETYGPFDRKRLKIILTDLLAAHPPNLHLSFYFNHIRNQLFGEY
jgi:hypothetical protein